MNSVERSRVSPSSPTSARAPSACAWTRANSSSPASSTETGESEDSLEVEYNGDPMAIGFNAQYLLDFIKAVGAGEVKLELKDAQSAGQLRPAESEDYKYRYIVMPMRI